MSTKQTVLPKSYLWILEHTKHTFPQNYNSFFFIYLQHVMKKQKRSSTIVEFHWSMSRDYLSQENKLNSLAAGNKLPVYNQYPRSNLLLSLFIPPEWIFLMQYLYSLLCIINWWSIFELRHRDNTTKLTRSNELKIRNSPILTRTSVPLSCCYIWFIIVIIIIVLRWFRR